jgi:Carboxypeptidase regulatory-like domain
MFNSRAESNDKRKRQANVTPGFAISLDNNNSGEDTDPIPLIDPLSEVSNLFKKHVISSGTGIQRIVLCLLVFLSLRDVCAQTASTGALTGKVTDPSGAVVKNAKITLRNYGTDEALTAITSQDGLYRFSLLAPDEYELTVEAEGFSPLVIGEVTVRITEVRSITTQLAVKGGREEVVVKAPLLQTDDAALGRVIDQGLIVTLPLVNRNYTQILGLTAGTNTDVVDATQLGAGSQEIRANGARSGDNNFMLNGADANSYAANMTEAIPGGGGLAIPAPDTIQEFKVQNSLYDAQYGRGGGANVVIETRSGTADLHGTVYYFGRNEALNANNFLRMRREYREENFAATNPVGLSAARCLGLRKGPFSSFLIKPHGM